jgi:HK97 family phage major capsid protein
MNVKAQAAEAVRAALKVADDIGAKAQAEGRDFTAEERSAVTGALEDAKAAKARFDSAVADEKMMGDLRDLGKDLGLTGGDVGSAPANLTVADGSKAGSIGEQFVASPEYKAFVASFPGGRIPDQASLKMAPMQVKALVTGASDTSAGAFVRNDWLGLQNGLGEFQRPLNVTDLITVTTTDSDTVEYAVITGFTNNAAPVAESTTTADPGVMSAANGVKPESALALDRRTTPVRTIAHWMPATKRALSDAGQIRGLIDQFLRYGLREELEDQIILGDGLGENFTGISATVGVQTQAWDTDIITTLRRARTKVRTVGRRTPTAYLLNPVDVETIALLKDLNGTYVFGGPAGAGNTGTVWGLPVVENEAVPVGTGYVGDFRRAVLWNREQTTISVSDSHANFFIRNIVAILAEMRAAFGVLQPNAFVEMDLTAA